MDGDRFQHSGKSGYVPATSWTFPAEPGRVPIARQVVSEFATANAVPEPPLEDLRLALTEAVTNAVLHGYRAADPGTVTVDLDIEPDARVVLKVADDGQGMSPRDDSPGLGLGLAVIQRVAATMDVRPAAGGGGGTEVCMTFDLTA
jgi:serine/threonine-protein kinase RsbW